MFNLVCKIIRYLDQLSYVYVLVNAVKDGDCLTDRYRNKLGKVEVENSLITVKKI